MATMVFDENDFADQSRARLFMLLFKQEDREQLGIKISNNGSRLVINATPKTLERVNEILDKGIENMEQQPGSNMVSLNEMVQDFSDEMSNSNLELPSFDRIIHEYHEDLQHERENLSLAQRRFIQKCKEEDEAIAEAVRTVIKEEQDTKIMQRKLIELREMEKAMIREQLEACKRLGLSPHEIGKEEVKAQQEEERVNERYSVKSLF